jgi:hypothetical protein
MVALVYDKDIPRAALDNLLQIVSEDGLVDARHHEAIVTEPRIGSAPSDPASRIKVELLPKLGGDVAHQSRRREVQNAQVTRAFRHPFNDKTGLNRLAQSDLVCDQHLP